MSTEASPDPGSDPRSSSVRLHADIEQLLKLRFRHLDLERCKPLLHPEQPPNGLHRVKGDGEYPAVLMSTGTWWFADRTQRPLNKQMLPMKSKAPAGPKPLLFDDAAAKAVVVVEGEGQAMALRSVGFIGVVCVGGTDALRTNSPQGREQRRAAFAGKDVRVLFDFDAAGREAAPAAAGLIMEAGATRAAVVERPADWPESVDVEDWLGAFETPEQGRGALLAILGGATWATKKQLEKAEEESKPTEVTDLVLEPTETRLAAVYDPADGKFKLAVWNAPAEVQHYESIQHDVEPTSKLLVVERWKHGDTTYVPRIGRRGHEEIRNRQFLLPPPPGEDPEKLEALWADLLQYIRAHVLLSNESDYAVVGAYVLLSYVLFANPQLESCPYLRIVAPPGGGKDTLFGVLRRLLYRAFTTSATDSNIHRLMDQRNPVVPLINELHLEELTTTMINSLCTGTERAETASRCEGRDFEVVGFSMFGLKVLAGRDFPAHDGLRRRMAVIDMLHVTDAQVDAWGGGPRAINPKSMDTDGAALRRRLLRWSFEWRMPASEGRLHDLVRKTGGRLVFKYAWPLFMATPPSAHPLLLRATKRWLGEVHTAVGLSGQALYVDAIFNLLKGRRPPKLGTFVPTRVIATAVGHTEEEAKGAKGNAVGRAVKALGFQRAKRQHHGVEQRGWLVRPEDGPLFSRYGHQWKPGSRADDAVIDVADRAAAAAEVPAPL